MDEITNLINGYSIFGLPLVVLVPLLIEGLKRRFGLPTHLTGVASLIINILAFVAIYAVGQWPDTGPIIKLIVGLVAFTLAAPGGYSQAQLISGNNPAHPNEADKLVSDLPG